jgi:hypothetical protein
MRQHLSGLLAALAATTLSTAAAEPKPLRPGDKPKPIDARAVLDKLEVYRDEAGLYYVSPKVGAIADDADDWVFFGDGKRLYQQTIVGSSSSDKGYDWSVWSPRVRGINQAALTLTGGKPTVSCTQRDRKPLTQLTVDEAKTLLQRATFLPPLWQRQAHFLARDDDGNYFYVDRYRDQYGGKGYRVFSGQKGAMKELAMTNVVSDSAGEIYATKSGDLKIVTEGTSGKAYWKKGATKNELIVLELLANRYLIYRELGIYGQLGVVCDDQ